MVIKWGLETAAAGFYSVILISSKHIFLYHVPRSRVSGIESELYVACEWLNSGETAGGKSNFYPLLVPVLPSWMLRIPL